MKVYNDLFDEIISPDNLFRAWEKFRVDKGKKLDVAQFEWDLEHNIFTMHRQLKNRTYRHGPYEDFYIHDPKQRHIHKASVRDRILHHAVFSIINPVFEPTFIPASFSCRVGYGTHKGVGALEKMIRSVSKNARRPCFVLKADIQKFFDNVDHKTLLSIIEKRIKDERTIWLLRSIIESYESTPARERERERERDGACRAKGIPIGNLTSQLFANVWRCRPYTASWRRMAFLPSWWNRSAARAGVRSPGSARVRRRGRPGDRRSPGSGPRRGGGSRSRLRKLRWAYSRRSRVKPEGSPRLACRRDF